MKSEKKVNGIFKHDESSESEDEPTNHALLCITTNRMKKWATRSMNAEKRKYEENFVNQNFYQRFHFFKVEENQATVTIL